MMKSIGGFYYVRSGAKEFECKARGSFRKKGSSPVVGDRVVFSVPDDDGYCAIEEILPRKNKLLRPALCNIDALVIVCSTVDPLPNFQVIDKMTAAAVNNRMEPVIVVSKNDIKNGDEVARIYRSAGFEVFQCAPEDREETARTGSSRRTEWCCIRHIRSGFIRKGFLSWKCYRTRYGRCGRERYEGSY